MTTALSRMETIRRASAQLARAPFQNVQAEELMRSICGAMHSDSVAFLSIDISSNGQASAIPQHAHHLIQDATHHTYVEHFFRNDPILTGAVERLRCHGWAVFRLGDPGARVKSIEHEQFVEEFLYPAGIRHVMAIVSLDPITPNRVNIVGCHRTSERAGFTFNDLEDAQILAPATVACFSHHWLSPNRNILSPQQTLDMRRVGPPEPEPTTFVCDTKDARSLMDFGLTDREFDVVDRIAAGDRNRDISTFLNISTKTVENHLSNIFSKTGVRTRQELMLLALGSARTGS